MKNLIVATILMVYSHFGNSQKIHVHPNSLIGKIARNLNHTEKYAVTIGNHIFVSTPLDSFLNNRNWVKHEYAHVQQYKKLGTFEFLKRYLLFSLVYGYYRNPFELEAASHEDE